MQIDFVKNIQALLARKETRALLISATGALSIILTFVNGCFWHRHEGCYYFVWLRSNPEFWKEKIEGTLETLQRLCSEIGNVFTVEE